jgi:hypothetical protein
VLCKCGEQYEPDPNKPGLITQCWACGAEEEHLRNVDLLVASQTDNKGEWVPMLSSKVMTTAEVAGDRYCAYAAMHRTGTVQHLLRCTYRDNGR